MKKKKPSLSASVLGMHPSTAAAACAAIMVAGLAAMFLPKVPDAAGGADQPAAPPVSPMTTMMRWVKAHGVKAKSVKISSGDRGRGIFMSKPAKAGATLYEVPETTWMSEATLKAFSNLKVVLGDPGFRAIIAETETSKQHTVVTIGLLYERNVAPDSHWKPYIDTLPVRDPAVVGPVTTLWTDQMTAEFQSPAMAAIIKLRNTFLRDRFVVLDAYLHEHHAELWGVAAATTDDFMYMYFQVASRSFNCAVPMNGDEHFDSVYHNSRSVQTCLIPFADMVNHDHAMINTNTMVVTMPGRVAHYSVLAPHDMRKNEELLQSYSGDPTRIESTFHYMLTYGFVNPDLANTRGDYITLRIGGGTGSTVVSAVERSGRLRPNFVDALVRAMRVRAGAGRGDAGPHAAGRAAALAAIRAAVAKALRGFESTVAEDRALVATGTLPFWKLGTTLFRIRHKMTLGSLLDRLDGDEAGMFVADGVTDNMDAAWWPENVPLQERRESTLFEVTVPAVV